MANERPIIFTGDTVQVQCQPGSRRLDQFRDKQGVVESCEGSIANVRIDAQVVVLPHACLSVLRGDPARFVLGAPATAIVRRRPLPLFARADHELDAMLFQIRLASTISLSKSDRRRILCVLPRLAQGQIDHLTKTVLCFFSGYSLHGVRIAKVAIFSKADSPGCPVFAQPVRHHFGIRRS